VLVTGATGYLGRPLVALAAARGHRVRAFVRRGSEPKVPAGVEIATGDALAVGDLTAAMSPGDTLVHLVGTPRPSPAKAQQFQDVDLPSIRASTAAAVAAGIAHLVYVSVAHPAPTMHAYIAVRQQGEALVRATGIPATILRPWYVLGAGHWWPYALVPFYWLAERIPSTRDTARRLGLVTRKQMISALMLAIERGPEGAGVIDVPSIRAIVLLARPSAVTDKPRRHGGTEKTSIPKSDPRTVWTRPNPFASASAVAFCLLPFACEFSPRLRVSVACSSCSD
jgi:uncharacterized protein YbjT (DUF2867 family)